MSAGQFWFSIEDIKVVDANLPMWQFNLQVECPIVSKHGKELALDRDAFTNRFAGAIQKHLPILIHG